MSSTEAKRAWEKRIVTEMIALYCRDHHKTVSSCADCAALIEYAHKRSLQFPTLRLPASATGSGSLRLHQAQ